METIEKKVSDTILQQSAEVKIGNRTYQAAPPSTATLILVSEAVSRLPHIRLDSERLTEECLAVAKNCSGIGEIAAILILGAKGLKESKTKQYINKLFHLPSKKDELATSILEELTPEEVRDLFGKLLSTMQLQDFFGTTTFLTEINLTRMTKVEN